MRKRLVWVGIAIVGAAVLGVMGSMFHRSSVQRQVTACKSNLKNIGTALEMYCTDNSGRFPTRLEALVPKYLRALPTCPSTGDTTYTGGYTSASNPDSYTVVCHGENHRALFPGGDYPQYASTQGLIEKGDSDEVGWWPPPQPPVAGGPSIPTGLPQATSPPVTTPTGYPGYHSTQALIEDPPSVRVQSAPSNTEAYDKIDENPFLDAARNPLSTFSVDVDTASYSNIRSFLRDGQLPPKDAVRIEEMINYFRYDYPQPQDATPFSVTTELSACPWDASHQLLLVGLQGRRPPAVTLPRNLVFLIDVSGSMDEPDKLPLLKAGMLALVDTLQENDTVTMVVYAGSSGLVLPPTSGTRKAVIRDALERLGAGGSTNGAEGIELAYQQAQRSFVAGGVNRVILATDGDFNVGVSSQGELVRLIEEKRRAGVFLTVLGFGAGNLKDATMEQLADHGNGNYAYIDSLAEARKVLVHEASGTLVTIARDVKLQVELNPRRVAAYRLIGYENRILRAEDFNDDRKDAGEIGAGHTVTALYEIVPPQAPAAARPVDPLRYGTPPAPSEAASGEELAFLKLRYKEPDGDRSVLVNHPIPATLREPSPNLRFASAVAAFGMLLRGREHRGQADYALVQRLAAGDVPASAAQYRDELMELVALAEQMAARQVGGR